MRHSRSTSRLETRPLARPGFAHRIARTALVGGLCLATPTVFSIRPDVPSVQVARAAVPAPTILAEALRMDARLFDPRPSLDAAALRFGQALAPAGNFRLGQAVPAPATRVATAPVQPRAVPVITLAERAPAVPFPAPRPADLDASPDVAARVDATRLAERRLSRRSRIAAVAPAPVDNRSFVEKLFGIEATPGPALAYAALQNGPLQTAPAPRLSPTPSAGAATAVYDISARRVYLPNGETLEAHSGLGPALDDPRAAHVRMRGPTPPHVYDLTEREQLFHGVRALRLNPVGGSGAIFGRAGLLAHTYMLGPNGDSNGCVSFKDYDRFLQAYLRGEVKRLVVVSGRGQDGPPGFQNRLFGSAFRPDNPA